MILYYSKTGFPDSSGQVAQPEISNRGFAKLKSVDYEGNPDLYEMRI